MFLSKADDSVKLSQEPVIIRFKGAVPDYILIPHILLMFAAMLFSTRAGLEVVLKRKRTLLYATVTVITLFLGGLILGPVVQNYAFGDYWTGWPFGHDMTDNKTLVSLSCGPLPFTK
ncbi:MAG: hypothetical protein U5L09_02140 [Bacteroidales bacterium]|nr:hypothetical protein [Bacteroidales bacterium]